MADKTLRSITFPGLPDRYVIPEQVSIDATLSQQGKAADAKAVGDALKAQIAPAYSPSSPYAVGDLVLYNNALYRCKTAITTAEAWTPAHWEATTLNDVARKVTDLESASMELDASKAPVIIQEASGSVASFSDGADGLPMKSLVATIEPVQDLHGFDHPWPAGSGKNKLNNSISSSSGTFAGGIAWTLNSDGSITVNGTATTTDNLYINANAESLPAGNYILNGCPNGGSSSTYRLVVNINSGASYAVDVGSGAALNLQEGDTFRCYIRINSGTTINATYYPMIRLATEVDETYEPYSNICPITGRTGLSGKRTGKNLFQAGRAAGTTNTSNGITFLYNEDGSITINGQNNGSGSSFSVDASGTRMKPGTYKKPVFRTGVGIYVQAKSSSTNWRLVEGGDMSSDTFTITDDDAQYDIALRIQVSTSTSSETFTDYTIYPYVYLASETDLTYESPVSKDISVNWQSQAGTVYEGTLDIISGHLSATHKMVDLGTIGYAKNTGSTIYFYSGSLAAEIKPSTAPSAIPDALCSSLRVTTVTNVLNGAHDGIAIAYEAATYPGRILIRVLNYEGMTASEFKNAMSGVMFCYPLATSIEYQLTPQEVTTLLGNNVVYTDVGPVSVTAPRDTKMYVDNKIAEAVAAALNA